MRYFLVASLAIAFTVGGSTAGAQDPAKRLDLRPTLAGYVPTGEQLDALGRALALGFGVGYAVVPNIATVFTLSWVGSHDMTRPTEDFISISQVDIGVEANLGGYLPNIGVKPYLGVGGGFRYYSPIVRTQNGITKPVVYGSFGLELPVERVGVRLGVRSNFTKFRGFEGDESPVSDGNKHDMMIDLGFRIPIR